MPRGCPGGGGGGMGTAGIDWYIIIVTKQIMGPDYDFNQIIRPKTLEFDENQKRSVGIVINIVKTYLVYTIILVKE